MGALADVLAQAPLFAGLDVETVAAIGEQASARTFAKGSRMFHQGDPGDAFYILIQGSVLVRAFPYVIHCAAVSRPAPFPQARDVLW
jgi:signal-transduction protein with cAMP-binding, CBS, and nucleotidyltransferase domain